MLGLEVDFNSTIPRSNRYLIIDSDRRIILDIYMGKLFRSRDILLLGLANLLDAAEEIKDPLRIMSTSYKSMYGWIPKQYQKHNFHQLISRSFKTQLIEKVEENGEIYIRIASNGKKLIQRDFPMLALQGKSWDGKWRIIMFDVEEVNKKVRERLRDKLKELGFGMLQKSVFISPHDIARDFAEFAESSGIRDYLYILETNKLIVGDTKEFANKIWKIQELNEKYKEILDEIEGIKNGHMISSSDRTKKSDIRIDESIRAVRNKWLMIVAQDPFLPKILLPKPWYGESAGKLVRGLVVA